MPDQIDLVPVLGRSLDRALTAMADAIRIASEKTAADAVEYIADYLNDVDAVTPDGIASFKGWVDRGRP
jgi:hypothetical protein